MLHRSGWKSQRFLPVQYLLSTSNLSPLGLEPLFQDFSSPPAKRNICITVISFYGHFPKAFLNPFSLAQRLWIAFMSSISFLCSAMFLFTFIKSWRSNWKFETISSSSPNTDLLYPTTLFLGSFNLVQQSFQGANNLLCKAVCVDFLHNIIP